MRDEPHDRARGGRAPCKPRRGDHQGCGRKIEGATKGAARQTPPPCRGTGAAPRACDARATEGKRQAPPPPPTCLRPPKGGGCRKGGADSGPPSRGQSGTMGGQRGEGAGRTARPRPREASAEQARAGGAPGERTQSGQGDDGGHAACPTPQQKDKCRATCQCPACDVLTPEEGQRGRPPPPPAPTSHTHQGKRRGQRGEGEGARGMTVAGGGPPPEDTAAGWGGRGTRVRNEPHDRAQGEHAPCKPQRGDRRGCNRRKGRVTTGATRQPPPPSGGTSAVPRACAVLPTCLRNRADSENAPPPRPFLLRPPTKRARTARRQRGDMGGPRRKKNKKKHKTNNKGHQHARAGADSSGRRDMAGARGHSKGRGTGGRPWGRKLGGRDQRGGAGVTRAREQRW